MRSRRGSGAVIVALAAIAALLLLAPERGADRDSGGAELDSGAAAEPARARVTRVLDGDTIEVTLEGEREDVRYIGIDTPETVEPGAPVQCFGEQASSRNAELVEGRTVRLVFDRELRDAYDRLLAYVYADGRLVNAALVRGGYARTLEIEPNTSRAGLLGRLEARAGRDGRGLWAGC